MPGIGIDPAMLSAAGLKNISEAKSSPGAENLFHQLLNNTNNEQIAADNAINDFVEGKNDVSVQEVVMAVADAEMSFQFFMEVRNQLIDSYTELMRMQF